MRKLFLVLAVAFISGLNTQEISFTLFEDIEEKPAVDNELETSNVDEVLVDLRNTESSNKGVKSGIAERLIKKANGYFDKMWYAEAARIYDIVLEESDQEHTFDLLSKAADAHYYSGNMEKSYKWYHELYQNHKKTITEENFFKYLVTRYLGNREIWDSVSNSNDVTDVKQIHCTGNSHSNQHAASSIVTAFAKTCLAGYTCDSECRKSNVL